jgi:hypothetical protein
MIQAIILTSIGVAGIAFLMGRQIYREIKKALKKDREENTTKYFKAVVLEYAIVAAVCMVALILVLNFKDTGFLKTISHKLYGGPVGTTPTINPFSR